LLWRGGLQHRAVHVAVVGIAGVLVGVARGDEHLSTTLNVKNLFDKKYYTGLGNFGTGFYGEPRSLQLATKWDF
jgi:outer membrane receptor for ferric coprogen and ferric-rhodotorulic acid